MSAISMYQKSIGCAINTLAEKIRAIAETVVENPRISCRIKDARTLAQKMWLKGAESVFCIDDVYGIRVIVGSVAEAYRVLEKVAGQYPGYLDHDYIHEPKVRINEPYKGEMLRLLQYIGYKNGVAFEIQITTPAFHEVNEKLHDEYHRRRYHPPNL